jgi:hypothetical protein
MSQTLQGDFEPFPRWGHYAKTVSLQKMYEKCMKNIGSFPYWDALVIALIVQVVSGAMRVFGIMFRCTMAYSTVH